MAMNPDWSEELADRIAFIDFEASRLGDGTFPTELGWAIVTGEGSLVSGACLIRPHPDWLGVPGAWSTESERLTGITLATLERDGMSCAEVVATFSKAVAGRLLLSDNPESDSYWLAMLLRGASASVDGWQVLDSVCADVHAFRVGGGDRLHASIEDVPLPGSLIRHRAEPDAKRLALRWGMLAGILPRT